MEAKADFQKPTVLDLESVLAVQGVPLSFRQERVARFAVAYPEIVAFGTANSLAAHCSVTQSTVVRLAISRGVENYREFRHGFRQHVKVNASDR